MADRPALTPADEAFAIFCEQGAVALALRDILASGRFLRAYDAMAAACAAPTVPSAPRVHTGYMPKAQRNAVAHGLYSMGVRKPPARAEAAKWGMVR